MASDTCGRWSRFAEHAVTGLAVGLMARRAVELGQVAASGRWSRHRLASVDEQDGQASGELRIVCVVPMYLEQDIAADTVRFWHHVAQRKSVEQVVFVTTAKEQPGRAATTHDIVARELAELGHTERVRHLHCDEVTRFRDAQLNLVVRHAGSDTDSNGRSMTGTWIAVYNADSRPADTAFAELAQQTKAEPETRVFQQLVDYVVPSRPGTGAVAAGNAILQTWWTRSHYFARNTRGRSRSWHATSTPYSTFGHGEFVRLDFLNDIGGFPNFAYADGLLLGWICRLRNEPIGLIASCDVAEVPRTARDLVTQQTAWMRGLLNFGATVAWCSRRGDLRLTARELTMLRAAHGVIPVAWGLSTAAVLAGVAVVCRRHRGARADQERPGPADGSAGVSRGAGSRVRRP